MSVLKDAASGAAAGSLTGPWGTVIGAGIGALGSIANGLIGKKGASDSRAWEEKQAQIQRDWNEQMLDRQNAFTVDMWNKTNEYNSPVNQVERMKEAGLNPLYYGLDGSSANGIESAQALGYERPSGGASPTSAGLAAALETAGLAADVQLKRAQASKIKKESEGIDIDNANKPEYWEKQLALMGSNKKEAEANIERLLQDVATGKADEALKKANERLSDKQITTVGLENAVLAYKVGMAAVDAKYYEAMKSLDLQIKDATETKTVEEVKNLRKARALIQAQIVSEGSKSEMFKKNAKMNDETARMIHRKTTWIDAEELEKLTNLAGNTEMLKSLARKYDKETQITDDRYLFEILNTINDMISE